MTTNLDERLLGRWLESQRRQEKARARLANSSLHLERFEGWALDLLADALTTPSRLDPAPRAAAVLPLLVANDRPGR